MVLGVVGFRVIEGWSTLDSAWMVLITLTTIGFGEVHPLSPAGRGFTMLLIVAGLGIGTYAMTGLTQQFIEGDIGRAMRARRRRRLMKRLDPHYIVVGYGRLGRTIVEQLRAMDAPVVVIERDGPNAEAAERDGLIAVTGDASDDAVLRQAGIERARGLAVAVSSAAEGVYVTMSARELRPDLDIVTRVSDPEHALKAKRAGATNVVNPHVMGGWRMAQGLARPHASTFLDLAMLASNAELAIDEFVVGEGTARAGRTLAATGFGDEGVLVVAIRHADGTLRTAPRGDDVIRAGDVLIALGPPAAIHRVERRLQGGLGKP
jgi:voltage-gated potassium channel